MKTKEVQDLLEYFGREQACYTSLLDLSRQQQSLIEAGDVDQLLAVLSQKQQILGRVADIEAKLRPYKAQWNQLRHQMTDDERSLVDLALGTVEELLAELIKLERHCEGILVGQIDTLKVEIDSVHTAQEVHSAYADPGDSSVSGLLDQTRTL